VKAGVAINPATPVELIKPILPFIDLALVMTVNPGFGGQQFIEGALEKIELLAKWRTENNYQYEIEVDGGVNEETANKCVQAGADVLVAGSAIYNEVNRKEAIEKIRHSIEM